jgi:uncharacterized protein (DUF2147 family)
MTRTQIIVCLAAACLADIFAGPACSAKASDLPTAFWVNEEQGWIVETKSCGAALCGYLVGFRVDHPHPPGYVPRDTLNPDPAQRATPLCGLLLMGGFTPSKRPNGGWTDGWIYNPDTGKTYSGIISMIDSNTARLRAYDGVPLFGRTIVLHRETGFSARCEPPTG